MNEEELLLGDDFGDLAEMTQPSRTDLSSASGGKVDMDFFRSRDKPEKERNPRTGGEDDFG